MSRQITIEFEQLPLAVVDGCDTGLTEGRAEIDFDRDGTWGVQSVEVYAHGKGGWRYVALNMTEHPTLLPHLIEMIEDRMSSHIDSQINEYFMDERAYAAECRYEQMRDDRMMGV